MVLDMQIQEFGDRFSEISTDLLSNMSAVSPRASFSLFDASKLITLTTLYPTDFTDSDRFHLMRELDLYRVNVVQNEDFSKPNTITELAKEMVRLDKHISFPLIYKLLKFSLVLPVATATVEICFSTMKLIKPDLRNRMGNRFLNHALVCSIEKEVFINVKNEDVMKRFQSMKDRKGKLI
ncbi:zinc finger MYM-type protein 1-like protein [Tanacetum coccineum]|uniref:Zinc finger MYM-type protein 1-like protein n=1 Tax=Tanacetum coccineum TaxID=301880 RepID=A0ABQ4YZQ6_9ASTR